MERVKGIEPSSSAWEAEALPLSYTRAPSGVLVAPAAAVKARRWTALAGVAAAVLALGLPGAVAARGQILTLQQVERKFPLMSVIHIEKCDKLDDGLYDTGEMACVRSIYDVMYLSK